MMTAEPTLQLFDPNGELSQEELRAAHETGASPFRRCRIEPTLVTGYPCKTLILGQIGFRKYLVYVRLTRDEAQFYGVGPMPIVLVDAARDLGAEPFVMRINMAKVGKGVAVRYWGSKELELAIQSNTKEWHGLLLRGKHVADFARLLKGKISHPEFVVVREPPDDGQERESLSLKLRMDGVDIACPAIDIIELAKSCYLSDELWIFTCSCGFSECAGIDKGVIVAHENGLTLWKAYGVKPVRLWVFNQKQYACEVRKTLQEFIQAYKDQGPEASFDVYFHNLPEMEQALFELDENISA